MASRMEKYYENVENPINRRTRKNSSLYNKIYENTEYTNVEGIATIEKSSEIDISKIQKLLKEHESQKNKAPDIIKRRIVQPVFEEKKEEERNYDIRDVLQQAKESRVPDENENRNLKNTQYNILKNINIKNLSENIEDDQELKELINTITSTSVLNKLGDKELSLSLLDELKGKTMTGNESINEVLKDEINNSRENVDSNTNSIDKSFFTSSLNFKEDDFEELKEIHNSLKSNNIMIKILIFLLIVVAITGILFVIYNLK